MNFKDYMRTVGDNVRLHRENKALTRKDLNEITNISEQHIGRIERGEANPSLEVLYKISDALGTTVSALLGNYSEKFESIIKKYKFSDKQDVFRLLIALDSLDKNQIELVIKMITGLKK